MKVDDSRQGYSFDRQRVDCACSAVVEDGQDFQIPLTVLLSCTSYHWGIE